MGLALGPGTGTASLPLGSANLGHSWCSVGCPLGLLAGAAHFAVDLGVDGFVAIGFGELVGTRIDLLVAALTLAGDLFDLAESRGTDRIVAGAGSNSRCSPRADDTTGTNDPLGIAQPGIVDSVGGVGCVPPLVDDISEAVGATATTATDLSGTRADLSGVAELGRIDWRGNGCNGPTAATG
jgi:hypothetical protein